MMKALFLMYTHGQAAVLLIPLVLDSESRRGRRDYAVCMCVCRFMLISTSRASPPRSMCEYVCVCVFMPISSSGATEFQVAGDEAMLAW